MKCLRGPALPRRCRLGELAGQRWLYCNRRQLYACIALTSDKLDTVVRFDCYADLPQN